MFFQDGLTGSACGDCALYTASPLRAYDSELGVQAPPPSVLVRKASKVAAMQLTAVLPNVISYDAALQLFNCILSAGQEGLSGSRPQEFDGDAAGCCSARCHFLQFRHQCLWKRQQRQQAALQQTAGPPIVISYNAALPLFVHIHCL